MVFQMSLPLMVFQTYRPLLSDKLLVYLTCKLLDIPSRAWCSHGKKNIDLRCLQENLELVEWSQFNKVKFSD